MSFKSLKSARTLTRNIGSAALAAAICVAAVPLSSFAAAKSATLKAAALTHRWSFNTDGYDYTDSITGAAPVSKFGNDGNRKTQGGKLVLTGSGSGQGSLGLGKNLLGSGDATVEIWASHDAVKNYARVFDYGNGSYGLRELHGNSLRERDHRDAQRFRARHGAVGRRIRPGVCRRPRGCGELDVLRRFRHRRPERGSRRSDDHRDTRRHDHVHHPVRRDAHLGGNPLRRTLRHEVGAERLERDGLLVHVA